MTTNQEKKVDPQKFLHIALAILLEEHGGELRITKRLLEQMDRRIPNGRFTWYSDPSTDDMVLILEKGL